ncbi:hypothetical protein FF38_06345 [Lucilia cuprina]|uniref:C2H2-type domain-containing protein n=1 Tax=Lucilia cuprina TaxID=7375 RepID=A0A0L0C3F1_LUCCU|nr:hypothetical protein FF38_06345 [Lucilia cuprina]
MNNIKLEDIEHTSNGDHIYAEKQTCVLEENDTQCGHVFYNEITRLLKFYCSYCRETYDNIEYFCQHLSEHLKEETHEEMEGPEDEQEFMTPEEEEGLLEEENEVEFLADLEEECIDKTLGSEKEINELDISSYPQTQTEDDDDEDTRDAFEFDEELDKQSLNTDISGHNFGRDDLPLEHDLNNTEMLIEEIEDAEEIRAEVEQEMRDNLTEDNSFILLTDNTTLKDTKISTLASSSSPDKVKSGNSFEECFINETNIDKIRSEGVCVLKEKGPKEQRNRPMHKKRTNIQDLLRLKRRRKKVTTVKVIAVKNRIAELYERIQNEQQKSQQIFSSDLLNAQHEQETQDAIESLIDNNEIVTTTKLNPATQTAESIANTSEVTRKIIGETVITLIPEGTKIPNKLPSPVSKTVDNDLVKSELRPLNPGRYNHYREKEEEGKNKLAVCPACGKTFRSHFSLTIHKRIHYLESDSSVKLAHKCSDCDELFNKLSQLKHHVESVHYPDGFICKICNRQLSSLSLLERHMVKVHLDRPFNCKQCNKNFSDPLTFEEHLASHNSGQVFKCSTCGRKYSTEYFLMEHMRNHKEQVPQTCVVCGKVTLRITQHMKIHTPRPKRLLSCSVCGKVFNFSSGLSHHFKIMHKLPRPPPKPKKEQSNQTIKRKRRPRSNEMRSMNRKKQLTLNSSESESTFQQIPSNKYTPQIIEEQIEIPQHEVFDNAVTGNSYLNLQTTQSVNITNPSQSYITLRNNHQQVLPASELQPAGDVVINHKEEEAKRVIVELIQNSTYTSFYPDNFSSVLEVTPPIAREETISAVNSIVHDC